MSLIVDIDGITNLSNRHALRMQGNRIKIQFRFIRA